MKVNLAILSCIVGLILISVILATAQTKGLFIPRDFYELMLDSGYTHPPYTAWSYNKFGDECMQSSVFGHSMVDSVVPSYVMREVEKGRTPKEFLASDPLVPMEADSALLLIAKLVKLSETDTVKYFSNSKRHFNFVYVNACGEKYYIRVWPSGKNKGWYLHPVHADETVLIIMQSSANLDFFFNKGDRIFSRQ